MKSLSVLANAAVVRLLGGSGPPTVLGRVWAIVVDSIQAMLRTGAHPHVNQEVDERPKPTLAYGDPSSTIARVGGIPRIVTSGLHLRPRNEFGRTRLPMDSPFTRLLDCLLAEQATARSNQAASQLTGAHNRFAATNTMASPLRLTTLVRSRNGDDNQSLKTLTYKMDTLHNRIIPRIRRRYEVS